MSNCCDTSEQKKHTCPVNGKPYTEVPRSTVIHHVNTPWMQSLEARRYYFCDDPECDVVYFGSDDSTISKTHYAQL